MVFVSALVPIIPNSSSSPLLPLSASSSHNYFGTLQKYNTLGSTVSAGPFATDSRLSGTRKRGWSRQEKKMSSCSKYENVITSYIISEEKLFKKLIISSINNIYFDVLNNFMNPALFFTDQMLTKSAISIRTIAITLSIIAAHHQSNRSHHQFTNYLIWSPTNCFKEMSSGLWNICLDAHIDGWPSFLYYPRTSLLRELGMITIFTFNEWHAIYAVLLINANVLWHHPMISQDSICN